MHTSQIRPRLYPYPPTQVSKDLHYTIWFIATFTSFSSLIIPDYSYILSLNSDTSVHRTLQYWDHVAIVIRYQPYPKLSDDIERQRDIINLKTRLSCERWYKYIMTNSITDNCDYLFLLLHPRPRQPKICPPLL